MRNRSRLLSTCKPKREPSAKQFNRRSNLKVKQTMKLMSASSLTTTEGSKSSSSTSRRTS